MERVDPMDVIDAFKDAAENGGEVLTGYIERHRVTSVMVWHVVAILREMSFVVVREEPSRREGDQLMANYERAGMITPPIIADEHGDIEFYPSLEDAAAALESVDVMNGEYALYDSQGQHIEATAESVDSVVTLTADGSSPPDPGQLAEKLRRFVERVGPARVGIQKPLSAVSLEELVEKLSVFRLPPA